MSSVSIKISRVVADAARKAARLGDRSLTGQIEHWVRLGIQAEERLTGSALRTFKSGSTEAGKPEDLAEIDVLLDALAIPGRATERALAAGVATGEIAYGVDPEDETVIVEHHPDGTSRPGRLVGREFRHFPDEPMNRSHRSPPGGSCAPIPSCRARTGPSSSPGGTATRKALPR
jgi:hypothetical protein